MLRPGLLDRDSLEYLRELGGGVPHGLFLPGLAAARPPKPPDRLEAGIVPGASIPFAGAGCSTLLRHR